MDRFWRSFVPTRSAMVAGTGVCVAVAWVSPAFSGRLAVDDDIVGDLCLDRFGDMKRFTALSQWIADRYERRLQRRDTHPLDGGVPLSMTSLLRGSAAAAALERFAVRLLPTFQIGGATTGSLLIGSTPRSGSMTTRDALVATLSSSSARRRQSSVILARFEQQRNFCQRRAGRREQP